MSTRSSAHRVRTTYEFIKAHCKRFSVQVMCRELGVAQSGYYLWLKQPISTYGRASVSASNGSIRSCMTIVRAREA